MAVFARFSVHKIITNCPGCYHTLKHVYGLEYHVSKILATGQPAAQTGPPVRPVAYHDPCHLGRWSGIYNEPRQLLARAGWTITYLPDNRCCGAGSGMNSNFPDLANAIACERLAQVKNDRLCTICLWPLEPWHCVSLFQPH